MGVYLPKVEMPKGDETITVQICPDGSIWQRFRGTVPGVKAVPVPPHGRLIDAEKIYDAVEQRYRMSSGIEHRCERDLLDLICAAPTIIPEEEGET